MMSVVIKNLQKAAILNIWLVRKDLFLLRSIMSLHSFDVGLIFVSKRKMRKLNLTYKQKDESTDILSFPFHENLSETKNICSEEKNLGDIFLCPETIKKKYSVEEHELRKVIVPLLTHGLCHLCGYVHETEKQWKLMNATETEILARFSEHSKKHFEPL